jgi:glycine oxidase
MLEWQVGATPHVVILGGGSAGCAAAYYLAKAGRAVTIVEREGIGSQSSGWSAGGVNPIHGVPIPLRPLAMESYRLHLALWPELRRSTGHDFEARITTMVLVAASDSEVPALLKLREDFGAAEGFTARWLDRAELRAREPRLAERLVGGLLVRGNGVVDSHAYTAALAEVARRQGTTIVAGAVRGLEAAGGRASGVVLDDRVIPCDAVVVALGPWAGDAERWLGVPVPVEPWKGEIVRLRPTGAPPADDVVGAAVSLFVRAGGQVWLGSTAERRGFDREPSEAARRYLWGEAARLMPAIAEATLLRQTACLRPLTPDDLPIVGRAPGWENAYLATGGGMKGILLSTGLGKALADLIATDSTTLPIAAYGPERFTTPPR